MKNISLRRLFCRHREEEIVATVRMPYGYNKCCFRCKRCGRERWS